MINCRFENGNESSLRHTVVDGIIVKEGKILLIKRTEKLLEGGKWALIGGFVDRDETTAQAIKREVMEESGYAVTSVKLFRIIDNPNRPHEDRQNISFVYLCEVGDKTGDHDWEVTDQEWFDLDTLPDPLAFDHAENIELYKQYLKENIQLPIIQ